MCFGKQFGLNNNAIDLTALVQSTSKKKASALAEFVEAWRGIKVTSAFIFVA